jgi:phosphonate transport system permease protein
MVQNYNSVIRRTVFDGITFAFMALVLLVLAVSPSEAQMLMLGRNILIALGFFIAGAFASYALNNAGFKTLGEVIFEPAYKKAAAIEKSWLKTFYGWHGIALLGITFVVGAYKTEISFNELTNPSGLEGAGRLFNGLWHINFELLPLAVLNIIETIFMGFMATVLAVPIAFALSFLCAKNIMKHPFAHFVYFALRTVLNVTRSVEALIWAIIFSVWVGIGPFAGMLALLLHSMASLAKQCSEIIESVDEGPVEGIQSTGANALQTVWFAYVPQVILPFISFAIYRWDINIRMATIIGLVGGGGIGTMLMQYQGQAKWPEVGCIILVIAVVVWLMDQASAYLREALK